MKKAFDQTFRDIKREVNKKVLKVPGIEQKVLDATSNEPWGPHGSLLADIAHASKNYNDYQLMMSVIWKRINDIGKNWRHVYKGLIVLEYLVAHGSERVIEEIKEHAYQISTLSDFQYIDSSGKDQGNNVRKKSQNLVLLVNDKERIVEVRQKAAANRDKFRNTTSTGGMYKPGSGGYGDRYDNDRYEGSYGSREDDRNSYGSRDYKDDDQYGKFGDNSGRDRDRYGRDNEDRYGRDDDYRGRNAGDYDYGTRGRSSDRDRESAYNDDANFSSRESAFRADEQSHDARRLDRKFSEQNLDTLPTYEEAVNDVRSPVHSERGGETAAASAPKTASPPASASPNQTTIGHGPSISPTKQGVNSFPANQGVNSFPANQGVNTLPKYQGVDTFDEFDPRGSVSVAASTSNDAGSDLLALVIVPTYSEADAYVNSGSVHTFSSTSSAANQPSEDPFGDTPFKATPFSESGFPPQNSELQQPFAPKANELSSLNFYDTSSANSYDILRDILPPAGPSQEGFTAPVASCITTEDPNRLAAQHNSHNTGFVAHSGSTGPVISSTTLQPSSGTTLQYNSASFLQQLGSTGSVASHMTSQAFGSMNSTHDTAQLAIVPQPSKEKFQTKSTVWTDTLNRGLVDLNISGSKANTLMDIGVDFDAINRKEMRGKQHAAPPIASTVTMGRAMGSGSGIGRGSVGALRPSSPNPMTRHGMAMGTGVAPGAGMGMMGYNGMNQHMGMSMGMPMNVGIGQGGQNQRPTGLPPGSNISGGYNPMIGGGGYAPQPYRGGYR